MKSEFIYRIATYAALLSLLFFGRGLQSIENYDHWLTFSLTFLSLGTLLGILVFNLLKLKFPEISAYKHKNKSGILMPISFACALFFFGGAALINENFTLQSSCKPYRITQKGNGGLKTKQHYVFINRKGKSIRINIHQTLFNQVKVGEEIELCIITGYLNFNYVSTTNLNDN